MQENILVQLMMPALDFFYGITKDLGAFGGYGGAIILLTLAIKVAFWSLTAKQYESMAAMKKIQPKIKELQKKHKQDPQKMQTEMMVLYKEHGVNPLGGCLPLLIQLPFMIALFATLSSQSFINIASGKEFLWIQNISVAETGLPILALLVAISTYLSQKTMDADPQQQKMMMFMPIILFFIAQKINAGVLLYWVISNLITSYQQAYMQKQKYVKEEVAVAEITEIKK
jgi:YidC/Oxa1 family membrane protein insertase